MESYKDDFITLIRDWGSVAIREGIKKYRMPRKDREDDKKEPPEQTSQHLWKQLLRLLLVWLIKCAIIDATLIITAVGYGIHCYIQPSQHLAVPTKGVSLDVDGHFFPISGMLSKSHTQQSHLDIDSALKVLMPYRNSNHLSKIKLTVSAGFLFKMKMPDSTLITINSDSKLCFDYPFGKKEREIRLAGEAYFKTCLYSGKGFTVRTDHLTITATTSSFFNVNAYINNDNDKISLLTGNILLTYNRRNAIRTPLALNAGDEGILQRKTGQLYTEKFEKGLVLSWQQGSYVFTGTPFSEVFKIIERMYGIPIIIDRPELERTPYIGAINQKQSLNYFLDNLRTTDNIKYEYSKSGKVHIK